MRAPCALWVNRVRCEIKLGTPSQISCFVPNFNIVQAYRFSKFNCVHLSPTSIFQYGTPATNMNCDRFILESSTWWIGSWNHPIPDVSPAMMRWQHLSIEPRGSHEACNSSERSTRSGSHRPPGGGGSSCIHGRPSAA